MKSFKHLTEKLGIQQFFTHIGKQIRIKLSLVTNHDDLRDEALQQGNELPNRDEATAEDTTSPKPKHNRFSFGSAIFRSCAIALLILGVAAVIHFFTTPSVEKQKPGVYNGENGAVYQVQAYIKKELANPQSFQAVHWSPVERSGDLIGTVMYKVSVIYKALGHDGKSFMASKMFELDEQGNIWMVMDVDPFRSSPAQNGK